MLWSSYLRTLLVGRGSQPKVGGQLVPRQLVLVVDDDQTNRALMEAYLEPVGCEVQVANSGVEALRMIELDPPDLVLTDAMMPGMTGFELCRMIKAREGQLLPVVTETVIFALAKAVDAKDNYTEAHTERVASRAGLLGTMAGLDGSDLDDLYRGSMIHDIGKIGVPDAILLKPGPLDSDEALIMRRHPVIGEEIARPLRSAAKLLHIIRHHHENFDGTGYPDHLAAEDIPLVARIAAISDAYDAMVSDRPYRSGMTHDQAVAILEKGSGGQWDPGLVPMFIRGLAQREPVPWVRPAARLRSRRII